LLTLGRVENLDREDCHHLTLPGFEAGKPEKWKQHQGFYEYKKPW
jgi:hypothetical protein